MLVISNARLRIFWILAVHFAYGYAESGSRYFSTSSSLEKIQRHRVILRHPPLHQAPIAQQVAEVIVR
jgi:hypothetical protein